MSLSTIDADLRELETQLSALSLKYPDLARSAASARIAYEIDYANAIDLVTHEAIVADKKLSVADKESQATIRSAVTMETYRMADAELDAAKKQIDVLQSILMSTQSRVKLELVEKGISAYQT
jgi:hypothetical protein